MESKPLKMQAVKGCGCESSDGVYQTQKTGGPLLEQGGANSVRPAKIEDAAAWGAIHCKAMKRSLQATLAQVSPVLLESIDETQIVQSWLQAIEAKPSAKHHLLSALAGSEVVGLLALAPVQERQQAQVVAGANEQAGQVADGEPGQTGHAASGEIPPVAEIVALEVANWYDPEQVQHASRLLNAGADLLKKSGASGWQVWIAAGDDARTGFYSSCGFEPTGYRMGLEIGGQKLMQHLWACSF